MEKGILIVCSFILAIIIFLKLMGPSRVISPPQESPPAPTATSLVQPSANPNLFTETQATPSALLPPTSSAIETPMPNVTSTTAPSMVTTSPTPIIIETIQTVELPPAIQYVDKPVYIDKPLDGMDMRERQLAFVQELNAKYKDELGYEIVGGEYCYNFTMHKEILIGYSLKLGIVTLSSNFAPLAIDSDKDVIKQLTQMISKIQEVQDAKHND